MDNNKTSVSDDEEDLEQLRLAALQTIKKNQNPTVPNNSEALHNQKPFYKKGSKRGRGFRPIRNGQFPNRIRSTNLIPIPIVPSDTNGDNVILSETNECAPKLIRPQDRYCNLETNKENDQSAESSSKFNRYDKSDPESESDLESDLTDNDSPKKLERADSLEELMKELENEIEGDKNIKNEEKPPKKKVKKAKKEAKSEPVSDINPEVKNESDSAKPEAKNESVHVKEPCESITNKSEPIPENVNNENYKNHVHKRSNFKSRLPMNRRPPRSGNVSPPFVNHSLPPTLPPHQPFYPYNPAIIPTNIPPYPYNVIPSEPHPAYLPQTYPRPLSPLTLNTDLLNTAIAAPLSPRSAAFVLENRAIIERRKRRSFSRSPSPRFRRSKSPRRDSISPVRKRNLSPENTKISPNAARNRLGTKKRSRSISLSPSPQRDVKEEENKPVDPIMEARKRKFESNELKVKEGVIRLKPKIEEEAQKDIEVPQNGEKDEELDPDILDTSVDGLFSDEESDEENEGRFKTNSQQSRKAVVLPFTKLLKSTSAEIKTKSLLPEKNPSRHASRNRVRNGGSRRERDALYKKTTESGKENAKSSKPDRSRVVLKSDRVRPIPALSEKKIEIKIRNPTKYEEVVKESDVKAENIVPARKVEVGSLSAEENEPEIVIDNEEDDAILNANDVSEGDLRAQLSRKRAERQNKISLKEAVPSRLLQTALESAVFKKSKKRLQETTTSPKDGKLPIHSRLGIATNTEKFTEGRKKKRKRNKNRITVEQV